MQDLYRRTQFEVGHKNSRIYRGSKLWELNVHGAIIAGIAGGISMIAVAGLAVWSFSPNRISILLLIFVLANFIVGFLVLFRGNLIALFPYAVEVGHYIVLFAAYRRIRIPVEQLVGVRRSFLHQGFVIRLRQRQGLLTYFVIPWFFGPERHELIKAIRQSVEQNQATLLSGGEQG